MLPLEKSKLVSLKSNDINFDSRILLFTPTKDLRKKT